LIQAKNKVLDEESFALIQTKTEVQLMENQEKNKASAKGKG